MARTSSGLLALAVTLSVGFGVVARAQVASRTPAQELAAARQALDAVLMTSLSASDARRVGEIKRDFDDLVTAFTAQSKAPDQSGTDAPAVGGSWRLKLGIVNSDLRSATDLDQGIRGLMNQFGDHLDAFYAAAIGIGPTTAAAPSPNDALAILDRMQTTVAGLLAQNPTSSGEGKSGDVMASRTTIDALQADITRLRMLLQSGTAPAAR